MSTHFKIFGVVGSLILANLFYTLFAEEPKVDRIESKTMSGTHLPEYNSNTNSKNRD